MRFSLHYFFTAALAPPIWVRFVVLVVRLTLSIATIAAIPDTASSTSSASVKPLTVAHLHLIGLHIRPCIHLYALTLFLCAVEVIFVRIFRSKRWLKVVLRLIQFDVLLFFGLFWFLFGRLYDLTAPERVDVLVIILIYTSIIITRVAEHFLSLRHRLWLFASVCKSAIVEMFLFIRGRIVSEDSFIIVASSLWSVGAHAFRMIIIVVVLIRATLIIAEILSLLRFLLWFLHFWLYCCYNFIVNQTTLFFILKYKI